MLNSTLSNLDVASEARDFCTVFAKESLNVYAKA